MILINCSEKATATETGMQLLGTSYARIALLDFLVVKKSESVVGLWDECVKQLQTSELGCWYNTSASHSGQVVDSPQFKTFFVGKNN